MPIYEYQCESCQHALEAIQKMSDPPLTTCPVCGKETLKKKISASAFRLKGGGWYETDFKSAGKKNIAEKASSDSTSSGTASSASSGGSSSTKSDS